MILPRLAGKRFSYWNANSWAYDMAPAVEDTASPRKRSSFLDEPVKKRLSEHAMETLSTDCLYGGYLEDRSFLWRGSYMEPSKFLHLGIDFVAPAGSPVCIDENAELVQSYNDTPEESGWGQRLLFRLLDHEHMWLVFGHLADASFAMNRPNNRFNKGDMIGRLGTPEQNGGWSAHLHVQAIYGYVQDILDDPASLDGYAELSSVAESARRYPDPMRFISIR